MKLSLVPDLRVTEPRFDLSPTTRFADRASDYARFRPSYPEAAMDAARVGLWVVESEIRQVSSL